MNAIMDSSAQLCGYTSGNREDWWSIRGCHRLKVTFASQQHCPVPVWRHFAVSDALPQKNIKTIIVVFDSLSKSNTKNIFCTLFGIFICREIRDSLNTYVNSSMPKSEVILPKRHETMVIE